MKKSKQQQIDYLSMGNPPREDAGIFGYSLSPEDCEVVLIPVPWEVTVSYGKGTSLAPQAIIKASHQLDLFDLTFGEPFKAGICMLDELPEIKNMQKLAIETYKGLDKEGLDYVNQLSASLNRLVYEQAKLQLFCKRTVGVVGGDHSTPYGLIQALGDQYLDGFGILHIDAHHDLRVAYEGFQYSHASIFYNVLRDFPFVKKLLSVGIRDFCKAEYDFARDHSDRINTFYDVEIAKRRFNQQGFLITCDEMIQTLPEHVYISFDIDGLEQSYCPSTGTPVPGGLSFYEAMTLIEKLAHSGRKVIGFDLVEVVPSKDQSQWDENVAARILYKLCGAVLNRDFIAS